MGNNGAQNVNAGATVIEAVELYRINALNCE